MKEAAASAKKSTPVINKLNIPAQNTRPKTSLGSGRSSARDGGKATPRTAGLKKEDLKVPQTAK